MLVKDKIEMLVRKVVMEYLNKEKAPPTNHQVLVILDDQPNIQANAVMDEVKLIASNFDTTILATDKWINESDTTKLGKVIHLDEMQIDDIKVEMEKADVLLHATAGYSTLAKLSLTLDDSLSMWIMIQMQMDGKQILLAKDHLEQKSTQKISTPFTVAKRIQTYLKQVREDKVQVVTLSSTCKWLESYFDSFINKRYVVLAKHIEEAANNGESLLIVPKNSLITPMCKDYARELGVLIKQKE
jgi:hypothetical protein